MPSQYLRIAFWVVLLSPTQTLASIERCSELEYEITAAWDKQKDQPDIDIPRYLAQLGLTRSGEPTGAPIYVALRNDALEVGFSNGGSDPSRRIGDIEYRVLDNGEWRGSLTALLPSGDERLLLEGNVVALVESGKRLVVVEGLAHLGGTRGAIYLVEDHQDPKPAIFATNLPDTPYATFIDAGRPDATSLIIAGKRSVMGIDLHNPRDFWISSWAVPWFPAAKPTSIVRCKGHYYVGLYSGVAVIDAYDDRDQALYVKKWD